MKFFFLSNIFDEPHLLFIAQLGGRGRRDGMGGGGGGEMKWEGKGRRSGGECGGGLLRRPIKCLVQFLSIPDCQGFFLVSHRQQDGVLSAGEGLHPCQNHHH